MPTGNPVQTEEEIQDAAERLARLALRESSRARRSVLAHSNDPEMIDRAQSVLSLVRSLATEDPGLEAFATQLLSSCRRLAETSKP
jgi:hypothetical protein